MTPTILNFFEYMYDRQFLKLRKEKNLIPWTKDPILSSYKFCNVRRIDDRGTQHIYNYVIKNTSLSPEDKLFNIILYRWFNVDGFFINILNGPIHVIGFNFKKLEKQFDTAKARGFKLFNDAYMICGITYSDYRESDKHIQFLIRARDIARDTDFYKIINMKSAHEIFEALQFEEKGYLIGPFLAYQILIDWSYYKNIEGMDSMDYCGPGTIYSLNELFKEDINYDNEPSNGLNYLNNTQEEQFKLLKKKTNKDWNKIDGKKVSITDIENCLCEFRKYWKLKNNIKTRIRKYKNAVS